MAILNKLLVFDRILILFLANDGYKIYKIFRSKIYFNLNMKKINFFNHHLRVEAKEGYLEHFMFAFKNAITLILLGLALVVHSIMPFFFTSTASRNVKRLDQIFQERALRSKNKPIK